jgi:hypothetical protein
MTWLRRVYARALQWWRPAMVVVADRNVDELYRPMDEEYNSARWHFKGMILDRLDEYFACMKQLRRRDREAYDLFSRIGLSVPADAYKTKEVTGEPMVASGGILVAMGRSDDNRGWVLPSFLYFMKIIRPVGVQWYDGTVYRVMAVYDDRDSTRQWVSRKSGVMSFHVGVSHGVATLLRECHTVWSEFRVGRGKGRTWIRRVQRRWVTPEWLGDAASEHQMSVEEWALMLFRMSFSTHCSVLEKLLIRATRGGVSACFGVDVARCKYFFRDRDVEALAADGKRKRIFHSVAAHDRVLSPGRTTGVRSHYRGIRTFTWNTANICIVPPANMDVARFDLAMMEEDTLHHERTLPAAESAEVLVAAMER